MKRVVLYCRISSDEQSFYSTAAQEEKMRAYCNHNGYEVVDVLVEDYSAKTFRDRPVYQSFVSKVRFNKKVKKNGIISNYTDAFMVVRWDRFSRNALNAMSEIKFMQNHNIETLCLDQPIDFRIPDAKMMLAIYLIAPEIENDKISARTKEGLNKGKKEGNLCGRAPMGYINTRSFERHSIVVIDQEKAPLILKAFEMFGYEGASKAEVATFLKSHKLIGQGRDQITRVLKNVVYAGKVVVPAYLNSPATIVHGKHEAIVPEALFNKVQDLMNGKKRPQIVRFSNFFPLRGKLHCERCGSVLTASLSRSKNGTRHAYYHCQKNCKFRERADVIHEVMERIMFQLQLSPAFIETYKLVIKDVFQLQHKDLPHEIAALEKEKNKQQQMLASADDLLLTKEISSDDYHRMRIKLLSKISELDTQLLSLKQFSSSFEKKLTYSLNALKNLGEEYVMADAITKRNMVSSIFPGKLTFSEKTFRTQTLNWLIAESMSNDKQKETVKQGLTVEKMSSTSLGVDKGAIIELFSSHLTLIFNAFSKQA